MVDRTRGELGFCRLSASAVVSRALPHHGEEPPISGTQGAGTIFFSSCNLRCVYCQNYQISHTVSGEQIDSQALSGIMLSLQDQRCHNIEPVTPTPQIPQIVKSLMIARREGLKLPLVFNCGGYENPEVLKIMEGMVDIYLPDFKYGVEDTALAFSGAENYPAYAVQSIKEMVRQVGVSLWEEEGIAKRGIIVRHLILPGHMENSFEVLRLIKKNVSASVPLSIMSQYTPVQSVEKHPDLGRRITRGEYELVVNYAIDMGFENIFTQDVDDRALTPDFEKIRSYNNVEGGISCLPDHSVSDLTDLTLILSPLKSMWAKACPR